jgi:hypothetical protein
LKEHSITTPARADSHGNATSGPRRSISERFPDMSRRKVPADSVPFGESISRNGETVWAAYDGETLVAVAATADDVLTKYKAWWYRREAKQNAAKREQVTEGDR